MAWVLPLSSNEVTPDNLKTAYNQIVWFLNEYNKFYNSWVRNFYNFTDEIFQPLEDYCFPRNNRYKSTISELPDLNYINTSESTQKESSWDLLRARINLFIIYSSDYTLITEGASVNDEIAKLHELNNPDDYTTPYYSEKHPLFSLHISLNPPTYGTIEYTDENRYAGTRFRQRVNEELTNSSLSGGDIFNCLFTGGYGEFGARFQDIDDLTGYTLLGWGNTKLLQKIHVVNRLWAACQVLSKYAGLSFKPWTHPDHSYLQSSSTYFQQTWYHQTGPECFDLWPDGIPTEIQRTTYTPTFSTITNGHLDGLLEFEYDSDVGQNEYMGYGAVGGSQGQQMPMEQDPRNPLGNHTSPCRTLPYRYIMVSIIACVSDGGDLNAKVNGAETTQAMKWTFGSVSVLGGKGEVNFKSCYIAQIAPVVSANINYLADPYRHGFDGYEYIYFDFYDHDPLTINGVSSSLSVGPIVNANDHAFEMVGVDLTCEGEWEEGDKRGTYSAAYVPLAFVNYNIEEEPPDDPTRP